MARLSPDFQTSARSSRSDIWTSGWFRWASTTSSRPWRAPDRRRSGGAPWCADARGRRRSAPSSPQRRQLEHRASAALAGRVRPDTVAPARDQRRLAGQRKRRLDHGLDPLGREVQLALGLVELLAKALQVLLKPPLEGEHPLIGSAWRSASLVSSGRARAPSIASSTCWAMTGPTLPRSSRIASTLCTARARNSRSPSRSPGRRPSRSCASKPAGRSGRSAPHRPAGRGGRCGRCAAPAGSGSTGSRSGSARAVVLEVDALGGGVGGQQDADAA